ncbi:MAG: CmcI family methyltransferase, partial [Dehalococcoidia bacterium]
MDTYFRNRVALYCAVTAAVTVAVVAAFDVTLVERAKRGTGVRIDEVAFERQTPPKPLQMADAHARSEVRRRYDELVARRSSMLSEDERYELLRLLVRLGVWQNMYWLGIPVLKSPEDMWMMQQIIAEVRPDYIVEAGTWNGGSA